MKKSIVALLFGFLFAFVCSASPIVVHDHSEGKFKTELSDLKKDVSDCFVSIPSFEIKVTHEQKETKTSTFKKSAVLYRHVALEHWDGLRMRHLHLKAIKPSEIVYGPSSPHKPDNRKIPLGLMSF
jgi:hypothetical protein